MGWINNLLNKAWNWAFGGNSENPWTSLINSFTGAGLTGAENAANQFNAEQASLAYERQKEFYDQYQSIGAQVAQAKAAGVNPAALYGNLSGSGSASVPQASGSVSPSHAGGPDFLLSLASSLFNMRQTAKMNNAEIDLKASEADRNRADTANKEADTRLKTIDAETRGEFNQWRNLSLRATVAEAEARTEEAWQRAALTEVQTALADIDYQTREEINDLKVHYLSAMVDMNEERALQFGRELSARLSNIIADTNLKNANASQVKYYCKIMLEDGGLDENGQQILSRLSQMSDAEIESIRKDNKQKWTKIVSSISGLLGAAAAAGLAAGKLLTRSIAPPVVSQLYDGSLDSVIPPVGGSI